MITHAAAHVVERFVGRLGRSPADPRRHAAALRRFEGRFGLYIHIPFCRSLCRFCSFVRYPYDPALYRRYKAALAKELQFLAEAAEGAKVDVLYVGGGTPTVDVYALAEILDVAKSHFGRLDISVEASPADVTDESISVLKEAGVERLSIGLQSLYDAKLAELGRKSHTAAQGARAARLAAGRFPTVNIDMIWGTRLDTPATLRREAALALSLGVGQVTFYPLMPAPGLRKTLRQRREGPWHPQEEALYGAILETASERGYAPATPWCFSRTAGLIDEYVVDHDVYLAAGASAIGRSNWYIYVNSFDPAKYVDYVERRGHGAARAMYIAPWEDALYYASTALFGLRWCPGEVERRYGPLGQLINALVAPYARLHGQRRGPCYRITSPKALYQIHQMQRGIYMGLNSLREWGMKTRA